MLSIFKELNSLISYEELSHWLTFSHLQPDFFQPLYDDQGCRFSVIFRFFRYFWPDPFSVFSYFIFLFLNFLSLFVFIFCETARTRRFSVIFAKVQWHPWMIETTKLYTLMPVSVISTCTQGHSCMGSKPCHIFM